MNTPLNQTHLSLQKIHQDIPIIKISPNLPQKDHFFVSPQTKMDSSKKHIMKDTLIQDLDQSQSDISSSLITQRDLLQQHKMVLQNLISNNHILLNNYTQIINLQFSNSNQRANNIFKTLRIQQYIDRMLAKLRKFKPALVNKFKYFIQTQKNFYKFLLHIYHSFSDTIVAKAMQLIFFIWELYIPYHKMNLQLKKVEALSSLIGDKIFQNEYNSPTKEDIKDGEQRECYDQVIHILSLTVILVIQKCPGNPYRNERGQKEEGYVEAEVAKQQRQEQQFVDVCRKKIKE